MSINYPPFIDEVLPAFYEDTLTVPFTMNQAVNINTIKGFYLKIKTLQDNIVKYEGEVGLEALDEINFIITFNNVGGKLKYPNSYKIQIAYIFSEGPGLFSNVGIAKYTAQPEVSVTDPSVGSGIITLTGTYKTEDVTEKLYSSYFVIKDSYDNISYQSKEKIHNSFNDDEKKDYVANENIVVNKIFQSGNKYSVQFFAKTLNNIQITSKSKFFTYNGLKPASGGIVLTPLLNYDDAFVEINLTSTSKLSNCKLVRLDNKDDFSSWVELLDNASSSQINLFRDFSIEHGVKYRYRIIYDNDKYKDSAEIEIDFEDIFLYDGEKQLKIRFNPKISGFKNNIVEQKVNTIGSKYPYIFRNGHINYKEFSLSGTISLLMDELGLFDNIYSNNIKFLDDKKLNGVNLTKDNIYNEKIFRDNVLEWLTNGKPKLFKSPTEGNYIVQLMNVSLSPLSDSINRMIYNFSSSVYEVEEYNIDNLLKNNFIKIK